MLRCVQHDKRLVLVVELGPLLRARFSIIPRQLPLLNAFFPRFNKTAYFCEKSARMSQVILELDNRDDLALLLTFVRRLNINVVAVRPSTKNASDQKDAENRIALMRQAASDPLFLADIADVTSDFKHSDSEHPQDGN